MGFADKYAKYRSECDPEFKKIWEDGKRKDEHELQVKETCDICGKQEKSNYDIGLRKYLCSDCFEEYKENEIMKDMD